MAGGTVEQGIAAQMGRIADGLSRLVSHHITLAKLELAEDARAIGTSVGLIAALAPFVLVGYTLLCGGVAWAISPWVGVAGGLLIVGGVNVLGGIGGILFAVQRLRSRQVMGRTREELQQSAHLLSNGDAGAQQLPPGGSSPQRRLHAQ